MSFVLVNVYGPNEDEPSFYVNLIKLIEERQNESILMTGDFNTTFCPDLDLYNHKGLAHVKKREILKDYIDNKGLIDIWRVLHPDEKIFTWKKANSKELVMSRLDFFCYLKI